MYGWVDEECPPDLHLPPSEPHEPAQRELTALDREIEQQTVQLREWQMQELLSLRQQLHALEREVQQSHQEEVTTLRGNRWVEDAGASLTHPPVSTRVLQAFQKLKETAHECQAAQLKKLREACDK